MLKIRSEFKRKYGKSLYYYIQVRPRCRGGLTWLSEGGGPSRWAVETMAAWCFSFF